MWGALSIVYLLQTLRVVAKCRQELKLSMTMTTILFNLCYSCFNTLQLRSDRTITFQTLVHQTTRESLIVSLGSHQPPTEQQKRKDERQTNYLGHKGLLLDGLKKSHMFLSWLYRHHQLCTLRCQPLQCTIYEKGRMKEIKKFPKSCTRKPDNNFPLTELKLIFASMAQPTFEILSERKNFILMHLVQMQQLLLQINDFSARVVST